jgi:hypothetical protein
MRSRLKILVTGVSAEGRKVIADTLAPLLGAVRLDEDDLKANVIRDLSARHLDRVEHARRMGWLCDLVANAGHVVVADSCFATPDELEAFGEAFIVWVDEIEQAHALSDRASAPSQIPNIRVSFVKPASDLAGFVRQQFESHRRKAFPTS